MDYPTRLELDAPHEVANWRPLVQWILAIPHLILARVLQTVGQAVAVISWFAIVFTGKLPEGLANLQCLCLRYQFRANAYATWLHETYPPFEFDMTPSEPGNSPLKIDFVPVLTDRNRLTVGLRLLWVIPIALYAALVSIGAIFVLIASWFAVLFTGRWPDGMRVFIVGTMRLWLRVQAYASLLTDEYPPFRLT